MSHFIEYMLACVVMGAGIGFDVAIATVGRFRHFNNQKEGYAWVSMLTFTHIAFPMFGYYGFVALNRLVPGYEAILGVTAGILVGWFLWYLVSEWTTKKVGGEQSPTRLQAGSWSAVLAVSWDALLSGPAKSAQAVYWSAWEVGVSFVLAGLTVTAMALIALFVSIQLNRSTVGRGDVDVDNLVKWEFRGLAAEFSIIGYFGILAVDRYVITTNLPAVVDFALSAAVTVLVFFVLRAQFKRVIRSQIELELLFPVLTSDRDSR